VSYRIDWHPEEAQAAIREAAAEAIKESLVDLKDESTQQAPVDTGDLRGNCSVTFEDEVLFPASEGEDLRPQGKELTGDVGYSLPYALRQHEDMSLKHPKGGKAKYLEDPYNAKKKKYQDHIASAISEATK